jgi:hypothetical protein
MIGLEQKDPHPPTLIYWSVFKLEKRKKSQKLEYLYFNLYFILDLSKKTDT